MKLYSLSLNHKNIPLARREKFVFSSDSYDRARKFLRRNNPPVRELALVFTCNRVEVYMVLEPGADVKQLFSEFFELATGVDPFDYPTVAELKNTSESVKHLFRVAGGIESLIIGENEILGQLKRAYRRAREAGITGPFLNRLFEKALLAGKKIRTETEISRCPISVSSVAVQQAEVLCGSLENKNIVVIGAGEASELTCLELEKRGATANVVSSRHHEHARRLTDKFGGQAVRHSRLDGYLVGADLVISQTAAPHPLVDYNRLLTVMKKRSARKLLIIDIAVPRDFTPESADIEGVKLLNIDDLKTRADKCSALSVNQLDKCEKIISDEFESYKYFLARRRVLPALKLLSEYAAAVRQKESERLSADFDLDDEQRKKLSASLARRINKLLHPIRRKLPEFPELAEFIEEALADF